MTLASARSVEDLLHINRQIHDRWFNVADVRFNQSARVLSVDFVAGAVSAGHELRPDHRLEIRHVVSHEISESEGVGRYDFNELRFESEARTLEILTGIPLRFEVVVDGLDVAVVSL